MTQQDLAKALDMPQSTVARIEKGTVRPLAATVSSLLRATGFRLSVEAIGESPVERDLETLRRWQAMSIPGRTHQALGHAARERASGPILILRRLRSSGVPFVLIGPLAEAVHGVPTRVRQIEICHDRSPEGMQRLAGTLHELGPAPTGRTKLRLNTETPAGDDYDLLMRNAIYVPVVAGLHVHVASIDDLLGARVARGRRADIAAAAALRAIGEGLRASFIENSMLAISPDSRPLVDGSE
jgi:transcriptional regulator with XRE-family HTH domain